MEQGYPTYLIKEKIADGGMGEVFKAVKLGTLGFEKTVVLKKLLPFYAGNEDILSLLIQEAKISSMLDHPNIVQTIDFFQAGNDCFLAMEFVDGVDLSRLISKSRSDKIQIDPQLSLFIISELLKGLSYAHDFTKDGKPLKIVHRDISPQNVLISYSGFIKLADFGIASSTLSESKTKTGEIKGKVNYMSPEQIKISSYDERSDLFSISVVLYELLFGRKPFEKETEFETLKNIAEGIDEPDFNAIKGVNTRVLEILRRGLKRDPQERFQNASEYYSEIMGIIPKEFLKNPQAKLILILNSLFPPYERELKAVEKTPIMQASLGSSENTIIKSLLMKTPAPMPHKSQKRYAKIGIYLLLGFGLIILFFSSVSHYYNDKNIDNKISATNNDLSIQSTASGQVRQTAPIDKEVSGKGFGRISINSHPWAKVYLNGKELGETPIKDLRLKTGRYLLTLVSAKGQNRQQKITVKQGKTLNIFEKFGPN
jgi:serine/threonine protein kinase